MNNEEILNSTIVHSTPFSITDCLKGIHFGFIFSFCFITFCFLIGTPANSWCLYFYFCVKRKVKQTQVFLLNHIIIELIFCVACVGKITYMFLFQNDKFYSLIHFFLCLSWSGRPLIQTCICIEQYLAVCHPVMFFRYKGIKYRHVVSVVVWLMSLLYALCNLNTMTYPDAVISFVFIITLVVISFCCVSVLCALKHPGPGDRRTGRDVRNQQKRNSFDTIFSALLLMLFSYLPQPLLAIVSGYSVDQLLVMCNISPFMTSFNVFGMMVTPLIKMYKEGHLNCLK